MKLSSTKGLPLGISYNNCVNTEKLILIKFI